MKRLLAATGALVLLAGPAAVAATAAPVHGACKAKEGVTVLKPGATFEEVITTPIGVLNDSETPVASFAVDLAGQPTDRKGKLAVTLAWDNPVSDYDLVVNGTNELSTDNPETLTVPATHCRTVEVAVAVFAGLPIDTLTLTAKPS
jgi:hypothetical protein